jgi:nucleolar pre-ribosomal-associated protein 1
LLNPPLSSQPAVVVKQLQTLLANRNFSAFSSSSAEAVALRPVVVAAIRALFDMSPATCCQPTHIEPLMTLYRGTPDETDQTILSIFHLFERHRRISVGSLLVSWSPDGAFAVGANHQPLDIVASLDPIKVLKTCATFPASRSLDLQEIDPDTTEGVYDPVYILSVYAAVLVEGELGLGNELSGLDWVEVVRSNVLGLVICALSSRKADMREFASFLLSKTCYYINVRLARALTTLPKYRSAQPSRSLFAGDLLP